MGIVLVVIDFVVMMLAMSIAVFLRGTIAVPWPTTVSGYSPALAVGIPLGWLLCLHLFGSYSKQWQGAGRSEYSRVLMGSFASMGVLAVGLYLTDTQLSRGFYTWLVIVGIPMLVLERFLMRRLTNRVRSGDRLGINTILVGNQGHVASLLEVLGRERWLGYRVRGLLLPEGGADPSGGTIPILGRPEDVVPIMRDTGAAAVIFTDGSFCKPSDFNDLARQMEDLDAQMIIVPAVVDVSSSRLLTRPVAGVPLVHVLRPTTARALSWSKRLFDIVGSIIALLFLAPVMILAAVAVKLTDGGPVCYRQERVGINGRRFTLLKLRTMVVNADELGAELVDRSDGNGVLFKMVKDPRVTPVGVFLRRYSIDELPQLFNVLRGDMSLVGPRPALPREVDCYDERARRRLAVRPGLSGLWQVSGRSDLCWDETVRLDLFYVDNWSMMQDLNILLRTVGAVLRPHGAY